MDHPAPIASVDPDALFAPDEMIDRAEGVPGTVIDPDDERDLETLKRIMKEGDGLAARTDKLLARIEGNKRAAREALDFIRRAKDDDSALPNTTNYSKGPTSDLDLEIKSIHEDQRRITGIATTKARDRIGDVVDPLGVRCAEEVPLFLNHDARQVVGIARLGTPTAGGVPFEASIAKIVDPGALQQRCDLAWQSVKSRLLRCVSIGFQPITSETLPDRSGTLYREIEVLELSLVAIPAQPEAQILTVKAAAELKKEEPPEPTTIGARSRRLLLPIGRFLPQDVDAAMQDEIEAAMEKCNVEIGRMVREKEGNFAGKDCAAAIVFELMSTIVQMSCRKSFHAALYVAEKELTKALKFDARLNDVEDKAFGSKLESLQRQLSRHSEHLRRIEDWKQGKQ